MANTVTLVAGGDIGPVIEPTDKFAELILPVLRQADLRLGQCERVYSERGRFHPRLASVWKTAGIDIVSLASNHTMDSGPDALLDCIEMFRGMGKHVIGAGKDITEARKPAIVERNGVKIAFLSYCSVLGEGNEAGRNKVGGAPMRAYSFYVQEDQQAGAPPRVVTVPYDEDVEALQEDVRKAKEEADAVVISIHWGLHFIPKAICDYQPIVAHAAIDAGVDLIIGHHPHLIKAVEVYKGKVCFYSIGNFMTTHTAAKPVPLIKRKEWNLWWYHIDEDCLPPNGVYSYPTESRKLLIPKVVFGKRGVERVAFLPAFVNGQGQPAAIASDDPKFKEILEFTEWSSDYVPHKFRVEGNEVVVDTSA